MPSIKPDILAVVICRSIEGLPEATLSGVLWEMAVPIIPTKASNLWVYVAATGIHGKMELELEVTVRGNSVFPAPAKITLDAKGPHDFSESRINLRGMKIPESGDYLFDLKWEGEILVTRHLGIGIPGKKIARS